MMRRTFVAAITSACVAIVGAGAGASLSFAKEGPPTGGCPPAGGWTLRSATEPGAPTEIDLNADGLLCGKVTDNPHFPGIDNYIDNVVP
jgi:hypothetical protein